jgi:hypothetical protein
MLRSADETVVLKELRKISGLFVLCSPHVVLIAERAWNLKV